MSETKDLWAVGATLALNGQIPTKQERNQFKVAFFEVLKEYIKEERTRQSLLGDLAAFGDDSRPDRNQDVKYAVYVDVGNLPPQEAMAYLQKTRDHLKLKDAVYMPVRDGKGSKIEKFDSDWTSPQERAWELFKNALPFDWNPAPVSFNDEPQLDLKHLEPEEADAMMDWAIRTARQWDEKVSVFVGNSLEEIPEEGR